MTAAVRLWWLAALPRPLALRLALRLNAEELCRRLEFAGSEHLHEAQNGARGVILVLPRGGAGELAARVHALYQLATCFEERALSGPRFVPTVRSCLGILSAGGTIALPLFERRGLSRLPARLALRRMAPLVPVRCTRRSGGRFLVSYGGAIWPDERATRRDAAAAAALAGDCLRGCLRAHSISNSGSPASTA